MTDYVSILETYSLEELFEYNDVTADEVLQFLIEEEFLRLPTVKPLDFE